MAEIFSLRLPEQALALLRKQARRKGVGPTQLARAWLLERLEGAGTVEESAPAYRVPGRHPLESRTEVAAICRKRGVRKLGLFGSAARDDFDASDSDVDLTVEFLDLPPAVRSSAYFALTDDLRTLFQRPVDVVVASSITNPYLRAEIDRDEVVLYEET